MREGEMVVKQRFDLYLHKLGERLPVEATPPCHGAAQSVSCDMLGTRAC